MSRAIRTVRGRLAAILLAASLFAAPDTAGASEPAGSEPFRATSHRRFDDVEHWTRVFDDPARDEWQKPAAVVDALGIRKGMRVADLGAGTGYFVAYLSRAVGATGTVFAVEVEPALVAHLRRRAERENTANVVPVLTSTDAARLPAGGVDLVLLVDTYHHVDHRLDYFRRLRGVLAPGGRVAVIDFRKKELPVGPPPDHKIAEEEVVAEMKTAGYRLETRSDVLPYQYVLLFVPLDDAAGASAD